MTVNLSLPQNWMTSIGGLLAGVPPIVINSGLMLSLRWIHVLSIVGGVGALLLGLAAKQYNVHSTATEVQAATVAAPKP